MIIDAKISNNKGGIMYKYGIVIDFFGAGTE
jgi:hypothetical protein